jgi:hypothetical protein
MKDLRHSLMRSGFKRPGGSPAMVEYWFDTAIRENHPLVF